MADLHWHICFCGRRTQCRAADCGPDPTPCRFCDLTGAALRTVRIVLTDRQNPALPVAAIDSNGQSIAVGYLFDGGELRRAVEVRGYLIAGECEP